MKLPNSLTLLESDRLTCYAVYSTQRYSLTLYLYRVRLRELKSRYYVPLLPSLVN